MKSSYIMLIILICIFTINDISKGNNNEDMNSVKSLFEQQYQLYLMAREEESKSSRSTAGPETIKYLQSFIKLGPVMIPYLIEKVSMQPEEEIDHFMTLPFNVLTKKIFESSERPAGHSLDSREKVKLYIKWWNTARKQAPKKFDERYSQWKALKSQGKDNESKQKIEEIRYLGIATLPMLMEKIQQGDDELIPIVVTLTDNKVDPNFTADQCLSWWEQNKEDWLIPFPNKQPKANAGQNKAVSSGQTVNLDGSESVDEDEDTLTYKWRQIEGPKVSLSDDKAEKPSFTAPEVEQETVLVFELVVNDGSPVKKVHPSCQSGNSEPNTVTITIKP